MKKKIHILLLMITIITMLVLAQSTCFADTKGENSGECGDGVTWSIEKDMLIISGKGMMNGYYNGFKIPWANQKRKISAVIIESGVLNIGAYAFDGMDIKRVEISETVNNIGEKSFRDCKKLKEVIFAENSQLASIEDLAFDNCTKLKQIKIPENLRFLGEWIFRGCKNLKEIEFLGKPEEINKNAFYTLKTTVKVPVAWIDDYTLKYGGSDVVYDFADKDIQIAALKNQMRRYGFTEAEIKKAVKPLTKKHEGYEKIKQQIGNSTIITIIIIIFVVIAICVCVSTIITTKKKIKKKQRQNK